MRKIAVTGVIAQDRMLMAQALSYLTGYDVVRQTAYSCQAIKYDLSRTVEDSSWSDLFVYALSSFTERVEIEQQYEGYISNGSVFQELSYMETLYKSHLQQDKRKSKEYASMLSALREIVSEYAAREYDLVIHIDSPMEEWGIHQWQDYNLRNLIQGIDKRFFIARDFISSEVLEELSSGMGTKPVYSPNTALRKAQQDVLHK